MIAERFRTWLMLGTRLCRCPSRPTLSGSSPAESATQRSSEIRRIKVCRNWDSSWASRYASFQTAGVFSGAVLSARRTAAGSARVLTFISPSRRALSPASSREKRRSTRQQSRRRGRSVRRDCCQGRHFKTTPACAEMRRARREHHGVGDAHGRKGFIVRPWITSVP